jgi:two-component system cell cycle sensor histidine kinase/response regulator CckA
MEKAGPMNRILLIEDSPSDALMTRDALANQPFLLEHVDRMAAAKEAMATRTFDLVLLDLGLPDSQGLETFLKLREFNSDIPVIVLASMIDEDVALNAVAAGAQDYIEKRFVLRSTLPRAIRYAIERSRTEESLRQNQSRLKEALKIARMGYWSRNIRTGELVWSDELFQIFGVDRATFGHDYESFLAIVHPDDRQRVSSDIDKALTDFAEFEHTYRILSGVEGRIVFERGRATTMRGGSDGQISGTAQDVTERVRSDEALLMRDRAMRAVSEGIVITDPNLPDNPIIYANPGFENMTGYSEHEVLGRNCRFLQGKDTDLETSDQLRTAIHERRGCAVEILNYKKDGIAFWNKLRISAVRNENGDLTNFIGVQTDVTARRELTERFNQSQKMEAVGKLAGGVAHDFNNLLSVISGNTEVLLTMNPTVEDTRLMLADIDEAAERATQLTQQLLAFSRQQQMIPQVVDINVILRNIERMLRRLIGEDIDLRTIFKPNIHRIKVDPGQLEQVIVNLTVNARDAMPSGGLLTLETAEIELDEKENPADSEDVKLHYVALVVSDTGCGMSPEVQSRVFEPFFTTKERGRGTGLGLSTVFGIVEQSEGRIQLESKEGVGTIFRVLFPICEEPISLVLVDAKSSTPGNETILMVEDEEIVRRIAKLALVTQGYTVLEAANGRDALSVVESHPSPIHLLITDVVMPGMSGGQLVEVLRHHHPEIRTLFMSGYTDDAMLRHGISEATNAFVKKPFKPTVLAAKVRQFLDS